MKLVNQLKYVIPIILALLLVLFCNRKENHPGLEYAPDMVHSKAYETYTYSPKEKDHKKGFVALEPVEGTIPVDHEPYHGENTPEGYEKAAQSTTNPVELTDEVLARGKQIYTIHCTPCHGEKGDGQGSAVVNSDYNLGAPPIQFNAPVPGYLTSGRMYHTITFGKGNMGSYASQVSPEDRWNVIHYINSLNESSAASNEEPEESNEG